MSASKASGPARVIAWWVALMTRHAIAVVVFGVLFTLACGGYAATHLAMDTDNADLISAEVGWRQDYLAYQKVFPVYTDNLVVVIDGATPEIAANASRRLARALRGEPKLFHDIYVPGGGDFFARNGLLYLETQALSKLFDRLARIQPFLGRLSAEPTLATFFSLLDKAMAPEAAVDLELSPVFDQLDEAFAASRRQQFHRLSWQSLMGGGHDQPGSGTQRFIILAPALDYAALLPAAAPMARIHELAADLSLDAGHGVQVRETGGVALADEELASVSKGAVWGAALALLAVGIIVYLGLRSWRLMGAALASLIAGLIGTAAFAAFAVGTLNLISIAFAVLYIGLGIDYAIHLCLRYRESLATQSRPGSAMRLAAGDVGPSLLLCAVTTAAGFFAFIPTPYDGVAELGLISGAGMVISLVVSLTLLPALIVLIPAGKVPALAAAIDTSSRVPRIRGGARRVIWIGAGVLALACATALPFLRFDSNTLNLKDPTSPSVTTYRELLSNSDHSPLTLVARRRNVAQANHLADALGERPEIARAMTLDDFVPADQHAKLDIIGDMALTLALTPPDGTQQADFDTRRAAIDTFARTLSKWRARARDDEAGIAAGQLLATLAAWRDWFDGQPTPRQHAILAELHDSLLAGFAPQIKSLIRALQAQHITRADLPDAIKTRWVGTDGSYRIEAFARADLANPGALQTFVAAGQQVAPDITGAPVLEVAAARTVSQAFVAAFAYAAVFITVLLLVLLRSIEDTLRVLAPLALTGLMVCAATVWLGIAFNFANVIALPLLLGVGVDSGIHVVQRLRRGTRQPLWATATARAVVLSSLTTLAGFGSLAFSHHAGTASMGRLLAIGMMATLIATLLVVPSLFADDRNRGQ